MPVSMRQSLSTPWLAGSGFGHAAGISGTPAVGLDAAGTTAVSEGWTAAAVSMMTCDLCIGFGIFGLGVWFFESNQVQTEFEVKMQHPCHQFWLQF